MSTLHVWMDGRHIADLSETRGRMSMTYSADSGPAGRPLISVSMPAGSTKYADAKVRPYFRGLLPEGDARSMIAHDFGLNLGDDMGLLAALGSDCAGALSILPPGRQPTEQRIDIAESLGRDEIERRLRALPAAPLGVTGKIRGSLAGMQPKLLLVRHRDDWSSPADGTPSTHIIKPALPRLVNSVENEAFCMRVAMHAGLDAATTTIERFGRLRALVSRRFDRMIDSGGAVTRIHQEDSCQALSVLIDRVDQKYQSHGGPSLARIARLLNQWGGSADALLQQVAFNVLVGNADQHGKNVSFLHQPDGTIRLSPLYDVMCTMYYDGTGELEDVDTELGLHVGSKTEIAEVHHQDLLDEAKRWGMSEPRARSILTDLAYRIPAAVDAARSDLPGVPREIIDLVRARHRTVLSQG